MKRNKCRACNSSELNLVYDFGPQPLAGYFPEKPEEKIICKKYDLDLTQCETCGLLMVTNLPPIDEIFHSEYKYSSSTIPSLVHHFREYSNFLQKHLFDGAEILEFGCNDGVLLDFLKEKNFSCTGVDASKNVANIARNKGHNIIDGFFTETLVNEENLVGIFDLITCSNVFAHIDDLDEVMSGAYAALNKDGLFCIEVHDAKVLIDEHQFDTIYHEHLTYFSSDTLKSLMAKHNFVEVVTEHTQMHGGGLRAVYKKLSEPIKNEVLPIKLISENAFQETITRCHLDIKKLFNKHGLLDGYGAAGRSQMFLNITDTSKYFSLVFDDSLFRQDKYIAGTNLAIKKFDTPTSRACIILAWNYSDSILNKICSDYDYIYVILPKLKRLL